MYRRLGRELAGDDHVYAHHGRQHKKVSADRRAGPGWGGFLLHRWSLTDRGGQQIDRVKLRLPILGGIWIKYQVAMLARMLSTLLSGGLPLVSGLDTASQSMQSRLMKTAIGRATQQRSRRPHFVAQPGRDQALSPLSVEMIEVGESTGALSAMLNSVADFFEEDVQNALSAAMSLIEPAIMIFMGVVVAFILISLYLPIFSMGESGVVQPLGLVVEFACLSFSFRVRSCRERRRNTARANWPSDIAASSST